MEGDLGASLAFGVICLLFACAGGFLLLQVVEKNMDGKSACAIYAPLLACWFGIWITMGPLRLVAWGLGILAIAWCILVPYRMATVFRKMEHELSDDRIAMMRRSLEKQPDDASSHFKLAELYEERGWLREAYQGYATAATLDRHHVRARIRTAELYKQITGQPLPVEPTTPGSVPPA
ncbi:MAG: tetratricopeptide repeat protein, partial [Chloroflexi bacterium]|nr:tetratricopeptide repeat protein [Chloroflexota bacterium]